MRILSLLLCFFPFVVWAELSPQSQQLVADFNELSEVIYIPRKQRIQALVASTIGKPKTVAAASRRLDEFFDEYVKGYTPLIQQMVKDIYHRGFSLKRIPQLARQTSQYGQAKFLLKGESVRQEVEVDEGVGKTELLFKILLIHEVAVHIGQTQQHWTQRRLQEWIKDWDAGMLGIVSEMTAAFVEKALYDAIDERLFEQDVKSIKNPIEANFILTPLMRGRALPSENYLKWRMEVDYREKLGKVPPILLRAFEQHISLPSEIPAPIRVPTNILKPAKTPLEKLKERYGVD